MQDVAHEIVKFIDLNYANILYLFAVGFVGGLVSGFIGSGGAFVLTPGMMSLGVPGLVAVASNMCHKFPKALVGAIKRPFIDLCTRSSKPYGLCYRTCGGICHGTGRFIQVCTARIG